VGETKPSVLSVVPTYRPTESVTALVTALAEQTNVVVSDDASPCTADPILHSLESIPPVTVMRHQHNAGIARGLNDGVAAALIAGATWLLTVDQDTVLPAGYVDALTSVATSLVSSGVPLGAIGAQVIADASGSMTYPTRIEGGAVVTEEIIQTGSLWSVAALAEFGGFDESLGIDAVDAAACLRLRERGMVVAVAPGLSLSHSIGAARSISMFGRSVMVTGHSPKRRTTMLRNRLRLFPAEFKQSPTHAFRTLRRVGVNQTLGLFVENGRWAKAKGTIRGLTPGEDR
jgi:rhamnosyltransferase